ncbi:hypothetical protein [Parasitella parasitica]|uniref:Phytanoyl-CoA dioxygenase n=1 Tax=Parasitella parasitica TaxID=35722 RepID=A0A0B7N9W6_9FUNG|nr:hypothetical protein [Parasitella parasitica]
MITDINGVPIQNTLRDEGYVIIDNLIPHELFDNLVEACDRVVDQARRGDWKYRRLVGTQFPPWTEGTDVWGVQHLMHPNLKEPVFAEWYGSSQLQSAVCQLLDTKLDELQLELFNLLINPQNSDFDLTWHRDSVPAETDEEKEREMLELPHYGTQWNTALYQDECLYVVPRSHRRVRTPAERHITIHDPKSHDMPGMLKVVLKPGQSVFYDSNILHRAAYEHGTKRATLHACMGTIEGGGHRAANIFQHDLDWMKTPAFKQSLPSNLHIPHANTLAMAEAAGLSKLETAPIH